MVVLKYLVYIYCRKGMQLFSTMFVPNFCLYLELLNVNDEDLGPVTPELWPEVHLVHRKV